MDRQYPLNYQSLLFLLINIFSPDGKPDFPIGCLVSGAHPRMSSDDHSEETPLI
jgi:hypothetical protein